MICKLFYFLKKIHKNFGQPKFFPDNQNKWPTCPADKLIYFLTSNAVGEGIQKQNYLLFYCVELRVYKNKNKTSFIFKK